MREYVPGDDIRMIDWNVTARTGVPHVKLLAEERELTVMLMVDASGSERFGGVGRLKIELAAELCAVLAFSAIQNNDKVGLIVFTDDVELYVPPSKGRNTCCASFVKCSISSRGAVATFPARSTSSTASLAPGRCSRV